MWLPQLLQTQKAVPLAPLSLSERITTGMWIATLVVNLIAAGIAFVAAWIAKQALADQKSARATDRRERIFDALLRRPALTELPEFTRNATALLATGCAKIASLTSTQAQETFGVLTEELTTHFNELYLSLRERILSAASVWQDQEFTNSLEASLSAMQDAITERVAQLAIPKRNGEGLAGLISDHSNRLLARIVNYEVRLPARSIPQDK